MGRKRSGLILIGLGGILALIAGVVVFLTVLRATAPAPEVAVTSVIVAAVEIPERTLIQPSMLRVVSYPNDVLPKDVRTKPDDVVGKFTVSRIYPGEPLVAQKVADTKGASGMSYALDKGTVLVAVNYEGATNLISTGFLKAGDFVDLVVNVQTDKGPEVATTMRNVKIFAVGSGATQQGQNQQGQNQQQGQTKIPATLLLFEVPPQDALILKSHEQLGTDLLLRAAGDDDAPALQPVTIDYLVTKYGIVPPKINK